MLLSLFTMKKQVEVFYEAMLLILTQVGLGNLIENAPGWYYPVRNIPKSLFRAL